MTNFVDLFSGCGGASIGLRDAGLVPVAAVELEPSAAAAYEANLGVAPVVADIRGLSGADVLGRGELALLFASPPCQGFSMLRAGVPTDRTRNSLVAEYLRLVSELRPRHTVMENVPGMVNRSWYHLFRAFLTGLKNLGYRAVWDVVDAASHGVPQHRLRVIVVASRTTSPVLPALTHGPPAKPGQLPLTGAVPWQTVRGTIGNCPPLANGERSTDPYHFASVHTDLVLRRLRAVPLGGSAVDLPEELRPNYHDQFGKYKRLWWDRPAPTLMSSCTMISGRGMVHPDQDRAISLREAMLLQSFPRCTELRGSSDQMALQIGNAVPPLLARQIGTAVLAMGTGCN
ncbi:MAG: DNA cytosine methyltransferase [Acidimicrobiales bacterium]